MTRLAIQNLRALLELRKPHKIFAAPSVPIVDLDPYHLAKLLGDRGWEWRLWLPVKSRNKKQSLQFVDGYVQGAPKIWYSTKKQLVPKYMCALLKAEELFKAGCKIIPHNEPEHVYERYLMHDFKEDMHNTDKKIWR